MLHWLYIYISEEVTRRLEYKRNLENQGMLPPTLEFSASFS